MLRRLILAVACLSGLAACEANMEDYDYQTRYPIKVETQTAMLVLDPGPGGRVRASDVAAIDEFARDYNNRAAGVIDVVIGANSAQDPLAIGFARDIHGILTGRGVPAGAVNISFAVDPTSAKYGRAEMQFPIYVALATECGTFKDQPGFTPLNENTYGFGCANQRNLAAMVVNPKDLVDMQTPTGRLAARSNVVVGKYIVGNIIGAAGSERATIPFNTTTGGL